MIGCKPEFSLYHSPLPLEPPGSPADQKLRILLQTLPVGRAPFRRGQVSVSVRPGFTPKTEGEQSPDTYIVRLSLNLASSRAFCFLRSM